MALKGYRSYQGRGVRLKRAIIAILCLLMLVAIATVVLLSKYPVLAEDGSLLWEKLWSWEQSPSPQEEQQPSPAQTEQPIEPDTQAHPQETESNTLSVLLPLTELPLASLPEGVTGVVYTVKDNTGRIFYSSTAGQHNAVVATVAEQEQLERLCQQEGVYTVARLNCFHDSYYAYTHINEAGLCSGGQLWTDNLSYYWLDAEKQSARSYVIALAKECAKMGFQELLLEELCYPISGKTERLTASQQIREDALVQFLTELRQELEGEDIRITLLLDEKLLTADVAQSGIAVERLLPLVDGVYTDAEEAYARSLLGEAGKNLPLLIWADERWTETSATK